MEGTRRGKAVEITDPNADQRIRDLGGARNAGQSKGGGGRGFSPVAPAFKPGWGGEAGGQRWRKEGETPSLGLEPLKITDGAEGERGHRRRSSGREGSNGGVALGE